MIGWGHKTEVAPFSPSAKKTRRNVSYWNHVVEVVLCRIFYEFVTSYFLFSFYSPYVILLRIVLLVPLKYHTGSRSCRLLQYNIITTKTYKSISSVI